MITGLSGFFILASPSCWVNLPEEVEGGMISGRQTCQAVFTGKVST